MKEKLVIEKLRNSWRSRLELLRKFVYITTWVAVAFSLTKKKRNKEGKIGKGRKSRWTCIRARTFLQKSSLLSPHTQQWEQIKNESSSGKLTSIFFACQFSKWLLNWKWSLKRRKKDESQGNDETRNGKLFKEAYKAQKPRLNSGLRLSERSYNEGRKDPVCLAK